MFNKFKTGFINIALKFMSVEEKIFRMFLETSPSNVNEIVILPAVKVVMENIVKKLKNKRKYGQVYNGNLNGVEVSVIQSFVGCPHIAERMESLKYTKCKKVIRVDFCGGLDYLGEPMEPGKIIIPEFALCGDGTSPYYILTYYDKFKELEFIENPIFGLKKVKAGNERIYKVFPSEELYEILLKNAKELYPEKSMKGPVWTTDALFCETDEIVEAWIKSEILGIDMESSLLFLLGQLFNIKTASIISVSDVPGHKKFDIFKSNHIHPDTFLGVDKAINIVVKSLGQIQNIP